MIKAVKNVHLVFGTAGTAEKTVNILIENGKFTQIGENTAIPDKAMVIDGSGLTALPGLIDMHSHIGGSTDPAYPASGSRKETYDYVRAREGFLRWGVTTVRSCGDHTDDILSFREDEKAGKVLAPRIVCCGPYIQNPDGHPWGTVFFKDEKLKEKAIVFVDTDAPIEEQVDRVAEKGVDFIKVFYSDLDLIRNMQDAPRMPEEKLKRVIESAHRNGLKCACHTDGPLGMLAAARAGADTIEHMINVGNTEKLEITEEMIRVLKENKTVVDPTLIATYNAAGDSYGDLCRAAEEDVGILYHAGIPIAVGCDSGIPCSEFGESIHDEMMCLHHAGIPAAEVIKLATIGNAKILGMDDRIGSIEPGKEADLVLVKGDPAADLACTRNIVLVMKQGRIVRDEL